ncbi:precorrin-2 C(20)-methyltransferase [Candidatus Endowatersipora endosymbiont of Watersipora subatra]|uniref:precorrin-2 C(20)-methyltransferase n=1 Tax=Candidatus Endowatersipora endosymbiont of Watersipora subatra TaxID=3077946 RepID=UPI00312C8EC7
MSTGRLYGLGVGPGDPELLTLKAHRLLTSSDVVVYPSPDSVSGESFARSIVSRYLLSTQVEIPFVIPVRVDSFLARSIYDQISLKISSYLDLGHDVAIICEGDPFFYGSFIYLYHRLAIRYSCQVVPGISSIMASSAYFGRPLAARNDILIIIPAPVDDVVLEQALDHADAIAIIKIGRHFERMYEKIVTAGLLEKAVYLERISLDKQTILPLSLMLGKQASYFSMILIYKGEEAWIK